MYMAMAKVMAPTPNGTGRRHQGAAASATFVSSPLTRPTSSDSGFGVVTPETTSGREGFIHLYNMSGGAAQATLEFILRDFERDALAAQGDLRAIVHILA